MTRAFTLVPLAGLLLLPTQAHAGRAISWISEITQSDPSLFTQWTAGDLLLWLLALLPA